jgi:FMN phosphatase YigB (HAD superfamily)
MTLQQTHKIDLVLFDVGGVIIDLFLDSARQALLNQCRMPVSVYQDITRATFEQQPFSATENATIGVATTEEYLEEFRRGCDNRVSISTIKSNLEGVIGPERSEMVELIRTLSNRVRVAAFTNTIELHWNLLIDRARFSFFGLVERVIASHIIGLAKPMPAAYRAVSEILVVDPMNVLFIDDIERNVLAAREVGMSSVQYTSYSDLCQTLHRLDLL